MRLAVIAAVAASTLAVSPVHATERVEQDAGPTSGKDIGRTFDSGRMGEAMHACDAVKAVSSEDAGVLFACGVVYLTVYRIEDAEKCLAHGSELRPKSSWPLERLALLYLGTGDDDQARALVDRALALTPDAKLALSTKEELAERLRLKGHVPPEPPADAPEHVPWLVIDAFRKGHGGAGIAQALDAQTLVDMLGRVGVQFDMDADPT